MKPELRRPASILLALFLFHAVMSGPAVLVKSGFYSPDDNRVSIVAFDVCGCAGSSVAVQCPDFTVSAPLTAVLVSSDKGSFSPDPDETVASAESGRIEKPPKPA